MAYGTLGYSKAEYAKTVAATLAYYLAQQRDAAGLLSFCEHVLDYVPARYRPGHVHRLILALERSPTGAGTQLQPPIEQIARTVKKRGLIVLLSDFLTPTDRLDVNLGYLRSAGHEVILMRILDPAEMEFRVGASTILEDLETGRTMYVDPDAARRQYQERFTEHAEGLKTCCAPVGG